jgi:hypothetical protein
VKERRNPGEKVLFVERGKSLSRHKESIKILGIRLPGALPRAACPDTTEGIKNLG